MKKLKVVVEVTVSHDLAMEKDFKRVLENVLERIDLTARPAMERFSLGGTNPDVYIEKLAVKSYSRVHAADKIMEDAAVNDLDSTMETRLTDEVLSQVMNGLTYVNAEKGNLHYRAGDFVLELLPIGGGYFKPYQQEAARRLILEDVQEYVKKAGNLRSGKVKRDFKLSFLK